MQPTKLWYIERFNLFNGLQRQDMGELARMSLMEKKPKGIYIYLPSDPANSVYPVVRQNPIGSEQHPG
jgi:hypothetical protein